MLLDGLGRVTEEIRITRRTPLELPDPRPPAPPTAKLPDHPAYHQIMAVFATADAPLRARAVCEAIDVEIAPNNIDDVRLKLKRLVERGILVETEHPAAAIAAQRTSGQAARLKRKGNTGTNFT
ncbi:hypothetical protein ACFZAU_10550 [Streptomyces sp. NPDC008238]